MNEWMSVDKLFYTPKNILQWMIQKKKCSLMLLLLLAMSGNCISKHLIKLFLLFHFVLLLRGFFLISKSETELYPQPTTFELVIFISNTYS
ncbi:hypothetical protein BLOT_010098 [Blomia tropicalis]|nr:hypothetical protein BLOT_010098 [Blomia tropicalis]